jgi:nicotinamidase-related amidase
MATIRNGSKAVLLVVDVQKGVVSSAYQRDSVIANICAMVEKARQAQVPVIWVQHSDERLKYQSEEWKIVSELVPAKGDSRVEKHYGSTFEETNLEQLLATLGAAKIVLVGAATNWCIRATAYGALDRGYDLTLIGDAHTTQSMKLPSGGTITAADAITDLNFVLSWLTYPNRTSQVIKTGDFRF